MEIARPGDTVSLQLVGAPAGAVTAVEVVALPSGPVLLARSSAGVVEARPGLHVVSRVIPASAAKGDYSIVWDWDGTFTAEVLRVVSTVSGIMPSAVAYAPVTPVGDIELVRGDDYFAEDGRALLFEVDGFPSLLGGSVRLVAAGLVVAGVVVDASRVRVEVAGMDTRGLTAGVWSYDLEATTAAGRVVTLRRGGLRVLADQPAAA
jgi:hypothetical protein